MRILIFSYKELDERAQENSLAILREHIKYEKFWIHIFANNNIPQSSEKIRDVIG
jgi:hypothetical protein